ncbi:MAG TPA: SRPBCC family protein [Verrucomicrobiae bacterium]|nr:SRPBCC family protein [Verrucomicrobiae bacterium]
MPTPASRVKKLKPAVPSGSAKKIIRACTIKKSPEELFAFWRDVENLPRFSRHIVSIIRKSDTESHWRVRGPANSELEWDSFIINEHPNELIAWESKPDAEVRNAGTIRFTPAPGNQGTAVTVQLDYVPPAGRIGSAVAKLTGEEPELQLEDDLMRFKALMETGEVPTTIGQPTGEGKAKRRTK